MTQSNSRIGTNDVWRVDPARIERARTVAHAVVSAPDAIENLKKYYRWESNYAGATFNSLQPNPPGRIEAVDLLAVTTLSVEIRPMAIRRFTSEEVAGAVSRALDALDQSLRIEDPAAPQAAPAMAELHELVKRTLRRANAESSSAWVTASKICARKRPHMFPVRDSVVVNVLGLAGNYPDDWPVFAALAADPELMSGVDRAVAAAGAESGVEIGDPDLRLRHLDVLLWMHGTSGS